MAEKKYYWLKLQRDFFKRHDMRIIEEMENGKDYLLFYLKLLVESIDHNGCLRFSDTIPYNEKMLSVVTNTNIDIVRAALNIFRELNLVDVLEDETLYMNEVQKMIGSETDWAKKKRDYRAKLLEDNSRTKKDIVRQEKDIEKELDTEKDIKSPNGDFVEQGIDEIKEIVSYLNEKTGKRYSAKTESTKKYIRGRLSDGYTVEDFKLVIDIKCDDWLKDPKMNEYLRPQTLFTPGHFESYLNQNPKDDDDGGFKCLI